MENEQIEILAAERIARRTAFVGFAALFRREAETAERVLRSVAEDMILNRPDVESARKVADASLRIVDKLAAHCAYLRSLEQEGRGIT